MKPGDIKVLVDYRINQANECLDDARTLFALEKGFRTIVNRSYYAAFYTVLALLQIKGRIPRKHRGVIVLFDVEYIKPGLLPKQLSDTLHWLFDSRNKDDYISLHPVSREEAEQALNAAESFVQVVRTYIQQKNDIVALNRGNMKENKKHE